MKPIDIHTSEVTILVKGPFLDIQFKTDGCGGFGNSADPSTLTFRIEQLRDVRWKPYSDTVSIDFEGQMEFGQFRTAISLLARELEALYGEANDDTTVTVTRKPMAQREYEIQSAAEWERIKREAKSETAAANLTAIAGGKKE